MKQLQIGFPLEVLGRSLVHRQHLPSIHSLPFLPMGRKQRDLFLVLRQGCRQTDAQDLPDHSGCSLAPMPVPAPGIQHPNWLGRALARRLRRFPIEENLLLICLEIVSKSLAECDGFGSDDVDERAALDARRLRGRPDGGRPRRWWSGGRGSRTHSCCRYSTVSPSTAHDHTSGLRTNNCQMSPRLSVCCSKSSSAIA